MKKNRTHILYFFMLLFMVALVSAAQNPKGKNGTFALTNASIETVTNGIIEKGTVVIGNGKILGVGTDVSLPAGAEVIDCSGLWVYPGMIDGGTKIGLSEIASDQRTLDYHEAGEIIPQMNALSAVNPSSVHIPVARVNG